MGQLDGQPASVKLSTVTSSWPVSPTLGDLHTYGFDMAFAAVMLVLLRGMWRGGVRQCPGNSAC